MTTVDKLIFSTDYPFGRPTDDDIATFLAELPPDEARRQVSSGNAAALFGLAQTIE